MIRQRTDVSLVGRQVLAADILGGRPISIRIDAQTLTFFDPATRQLLRARPNPLSWDQVRRLRDGRPAGPPPRPATEPVTVQRCAYATGVILVAQQRIALGRAQAGQTFTVHVADTTLTIETDGGPRTVTRTTTRPIRNLKANRAWSGTTSAPARSALRPKPDPGHGRLVVDPPGPDCWLHPHLEIRPSPIAGLGLFAIAPIPGGTVVSRLGGRLVSAAELHDLFTAAATNPNHPYIDTIAVTETHHLVLPPRRPNGYGNHSCDPNLWWVNAYELATRRDIAADEEVTNDYATSTGDDEFTMTCACRTTHCRSIITGHDWRRPDLRHRYADHWVPVLLTRIRQLTDPTTTDPTTTDPATTDAATTGPRKPPNVS